LAFGLSIADNTPRTKYRKAGIQRLSRQVDRERRGVMQDYLRLQNQITDILRLFESRLIR
jgi:hypothetical protein